MDGKEDVSSFYPFNGINLDDRGIWVKCDIITIVFPGTTDAAGFIHFQCDRLCLAWAQSDFARQVDITGRKKVVINISIKSLFTAHDGIRMILCDMVDGLTFAEKRRDHGIQML